MAEWVAFERAFGPLGATYEQATLASIQEQLQMLCYITRAQYDENAGGKPVHWPRPSEVFNPVEDSDSVRGGEPVGNADELNAFFDENR